jgi:hypothetical protein
VCVRVCVRVGMSQARKSCPVADATIICRFVSVTPASSSASTLVHSICTHIARVYDCGDVCAGRVPDDYTELCAALPLFLAKATAARPLLVFIDSLVSRTAAALWYHVVFEGPSGAVLTPLFALAQPVARAQDHVTTASVAQPA